MGVTGDLAKFFLLSLALGTGLFANIAPSRLTGAGFQRLVSSVGLASLFGVLVFQSLKHSFFAFETYLYLIGALGFLAIRQWHKDEKGVGMWSSYFTSVAALIIGLYFFSGTELAPFLFLLSSVLYLGIVSYAMILGHYYLVVPKLSEKPLQKCLLIYWALWGLKVVVLGWQLAINHSFFADGTELGGGYAFNVMMLLMRSLWGLIIVAVMAFFTGKLVRMRSIQSATGILYAMTIFVFIGELISGFLFFQYGLFL